MTANCYTLHVAIDVHFHCSLSIMQLFSQRMAISFPDLYDLGHRISLVDGGADENAGPENARPGRKAANVRSWIQ